MVAQASVSDAPGWGHVPLGSLTNSSSEYMCVYMYICNLNLIKYTFAHSSSFVMQYVLNYVVM